MPESMIVRRCISALLATAVAGCGVIGGVFEPSAPPVGEAAGTQAQLGSAPINPNRFVLDDGSDVIGELQVVVAHHEDTFVDFARAYGLGFDELVAANPGVDPWIPGEGTEVVLPTRFVLPETVREGIVLNVATKRLFWYPEAEPGAPRFVETYPVGIGREGWSTPTGDTTVVSKARDPVWFVPASVRQEHAEAGDPLPREVPPGPDNPLGSRVLALGIPGYLIHGTNKPAGVGMRVSHGCVRLFPEDIEALYEKVGIGERVRIVNQPYIFGRAGEDLLLEAHAPLLEDDRDWAAGLENRARSHFVNRKYVRYGLDENRLEQIASEQRGFPLSVLEEYPDTEATLRQARRVDNKLGGSGEEPAQVARDDEAPVAAPSR